MNNMKIFLEIIKHKLLKNGQQMIKKRITIQH